MTIERPMFPPRAESVDSFSTQPAIGQPKVETSPVFPKPVQAVLPSRPSSSCAREPSTRQSKGPRTRAFRRG